MWLRGIVDVKGHHLQRRSYSSVMGFFVDMGMPDGPGLKPTVQAGSASIFCLKPKPKAESRPKFSDFYFLYRK